MTKRGKKYAAASEKIDPNKRYDFPEALRLAVDTSYRKFDETVDVAVRLGVDPRHADQMVRGSVVLPNGTGKDVKVLVFAKGEKEKEAQEAGADFVGNDDLLEKIKGGWFGFDKAVATPDVMGAVGRIGKILGPRGLMPNAKSGTVTFDVARAVKELKAGKIDFRVERAGIVHATMGKVSFGADRLMENLTSFFDTIVRLNLKSIAISTSMGAGIRIDPVHVKAILK
jgi:large subunit ribosomal protein L1